MNMNKIQKSLYKTGLLRWEIGGGVCVIAVAVLLWSVLFPAVSYQINRCGGITRKLKFLKTSDQLPANSMAVTKKADIIDSLLQASEQRERFSEPVVLEKLYELSDSTGCTIAKVQISESISVGSGIEIPVLLHGSGKYAAIGNFIDGIENGKYASRVRQLTMKSLGDDNVSIFLDFVIMESKG
jgi:hypothetical protein